MTGPIAEHPHARAPQEDPEQHVGPVIKDPWDDDDQPDWPNEKIDIATGVVSS